MLRRFAAGLQHRLVRPACCAIQLHWLFWLRCAQRKQQHGRHTRRARHQHCDCRCIQFHRRRLTFQLRARCFCVLHLHGYLQCGCSHRNSLTDRCCFLLLFNQALARRARSMAPSLFILRFSLAACRVFGCDPYSLIYLHLFFSLPLSLELSLSLTLRPSSCSLRDHSPSEVHLSQHVAPSFRNSDPFSHRYQPPPFTPSYLLFSLSSLDRCSLSIRFPSLLTAQSWSIPT